MYISFFLIVHMICLATFPFLQIDFRLVESTTTQTIELSLFCPSCLANWFPVSRIDYSTDDSIQIVTTLDKSTLFGCIGHVWICGKGVCGEPKECPRRRLPLPWTQEWNFQEICHLCEGFNNNQTIKAMLQWLYFFRRRCQWIFKIILN